jgi:hypothetical protein
MTNLVASTILTLIMLESGGVDDALGDYGRDGIPRAYGCLQIHAIYVRDVNRIAGTEFTHADVLDRDIAIECATIYLTTYGRRYDRITGRPVTAEVLARIHNAGPNGWRKSCSKNYWPYK